MHRGFQNTYEKMPTDVKSTNPSVSFFPPFQLKLMVVPILDTSATMPGFLNLSYHNFMFLTSGDIFPSLFECSSALFSVTGYRDTRGHTELFLDLRTFPVSGTKKLLHHRYYYITEIDF